MNQTTTTPTNPTLYPVVLTPQGAADYLGLDPRTVTRWARENYLPAHPLGEGKKKFWRFFLHELSEWLGNQTNGRDSE